MTRDQALEGLRSGAPHDRLEAARFFAANATDVDLSVIRQARQVESDNYVCKRLDQAIERLVTSSQQQSTLAADEEPVTLSNTDILARSVEWVGGTLLHEMEGPIGRASLYAAKEISKYEESKTKRELDALKYIFTGIEQLVTASKPPKPVDFDLAKLIEEIVATDAASAFSPSLHGRKPFVVVSDPTLLRLALANGLRNAIEAIEQSRSGVEEHPIVITWGQTDRDFWVSIIDQGPGISGLVGAKFEIGRSTKSGHSGFGLAIAKRAMESLQGSLDLAPGVGRGTRYELRWKLKK